MKKIVSLLLAVLLVLSALPMMFMTVAAAGAGTLPANLPTVNGEYTNAQVSQGFSFTGTTVGPGGKWFDSTQITLTDRTSWVGAQGFMFKFDSTGVAGTDAIKIGVELSVGEGGTATTAPGYTYLLSDPNFAKAHGGVAPAGTTPTSTWYICTDGVNWETVTHTYTGAYGTTAPLTTARTTGYVFIPLNQFWSKGFDSDKTMLSGDALIEVFKADGNASLFNGFKVRAEGAANNANFIMSELGFVYLNGADLSMPNTLPNGDAFYADFFLKDGTVINGSTAGYNGIGGTYDDGFIVDCRWGDVANSQGFMFKFDTSMYSGSAPLRVSIELYMNHLGYYMCSDPSMAAARGGKMSPTATSPWYYTMDGKTWKQTTATGAFPATIHSEKGVGYCFIPWSSFWAGSTGAAYVDANGYSLNAAEVFANMAAANNTQNMMGIFKLRTEGAGKSSTVTFTDFAVVQPPRQMPATLPEIGGGGSFYTTDILVGDPEFKRVSYDGVSLYGSANLANGDWSSVVDSEGIIFRFDSSEYFGNNMGNMCLSVELLINGYWLESDLSILTQRGGANVPADAVSTWYYSVDAKNWKAIDVAGNPYLANTHAEAAYGYFFIPWESFWYCTTAVTDANGYSINGAELFKRLAAEDKAVSFGQFNFRTIGYMSNDNDYVTFGDFMIAYSTAGMPEGDFAQSSVTLTDDLSYNLYVNEPAGATNVTVLFTMGGETRRVGGVAKDGKVCYSFSNILPQNLDEMFTIEWSATVDGETVTHTYTDSILRYLKRLLTNGDYISWHDLASSLVYYADAAQKYVNDVSDVALTRGVPAVLAPVTVGNLPATAVVNGDSSVFKSYTLRLDGAITLRVQVAAPAGVTMAKYTVGNRSGIAVIDNGYVNIPVYAYEMMETVTVALWNGTSNASGTLTLSASAYIKNVYASTTNANLKALLQTIANYAQEASVLKGARDTVTLPETTLTQVALADDNGMCYVTQLTDGRFIVVDGGHDSVANRATLWKFLVEKSGYTKPVIAMWMFTHQHEDHVGNAFYLLNNFSEKMEVQAFAYSWATEADFAVRTGDTDSQKEYKANNIEQLRIYTPFFNEQILPQYPNATRWDMRAGDSKTVGEVKIDVLYSAKDWTCSNPWDQNYLCNVWKMTYTQGTASAADDKTFLVVGDSQEDRFQALMEDYSSAVVNCDVLQAAHHGSNGGYKAGYVAISPAVTFMPTTKKAHESGDYYNADFNVYLRQNSTLYTHEVTTTISMKTLQKVSN